MIDKIFKCKYKDNKNLQHYILDNYDCSWYGLGGSTNTIELKNYSYGHDFQEYDDIRFLIDYDKKIKFSVNDVSDDNSGADIIDFKQILREKKIKKNYK